jgi:hypothetical protein
MRLNEKIGAIGVIMCLSSLIAFAFTDKTVFFITLVFGLLIELTFLSYWGLSNEKLK